MAPDWIETCLRQQAEKAPSRVVLTGPGRTSLSYAQLESLSARISATLNEFGVGRNHRVALALPTGPEAFTCLLSVLRCAIALPLNPAGCEPEFKAQLTRLKADCLIVEPVAVGAAAVAARSLGIPVITVIPNPEAPAGTVTVESEALVGPPGSCSSAEPGDLALVIQTSGTTGMPRKVPLTHANLRISSDFYIASIRLQPEDRLLGALPIYHITGPAFILNAVMSGSSLCALPGFYGARFAEWMDEYRPTWIYASPAALRELVQRMKSRRDVIARCPLRLIRSGASGMSAQLQLEAEEVFQAPVLLGYGMTETSPSIACNPLPPAVRKPGSSGLPIGPEVMVLLPSGRPAAVGEQGEFVVRGPNVMHGYEDDPDANREAFVDGWFRTGDLGWRDAEGYLYVTGRLRELINRGGQKIPPQEVEEILLCHPAVSEAAVFPIPHPRLSEDVAAAVVLREGAEVSERELRLFARSVLAGYKVPARICFLTKLPHGPMGKVQRFQLARQLGPQLVPARHSEPEGFVAPKTSVELSLARMWSEVLGISRIGIRDDFFALGGDSFAAAVLLAEVQREFGLKVGRLDRIDFLDDPTVAGMAQLIEGSAAGPERHRAVSDGLAAVALQPNGSKPPFFCVPPLGEGFFHLLPLSRSMELEQPFYALHNPAAIADRNVYTIGDVAEKYASAMRRIQPNGPYYLGGHCFGGIVAFETACQLWAAGAKVALLVLLDTPTPGYPSYSRHWKLYLAALRYHIFSKWRHHGWVQEVKRDFLSLYSHSGRLARGTAERFLKRRSISLLRPQQTVIEANAQAARLYQPNRYPGEIILLNAKEHRLTGSPLDRRRGWFELADGMVEEHMINGDHVTMLAEPYVAETSACLKALIEQASAASAVSSETRLDFITDCTTAI